MNFFDFLIFVYIRPKTFDFLPKLQNFAIQMGNLKIGFSLTILDDFISTLFTSEK